MVFDKKECAITSKNDKVDGELKRIQPLILPDPEDSEDSEDENVEDVFYDEDDIGDHNLTKNNIWSEVSIGGCNINTFICMVLGIFFAVLKIFFKEKRTRHEPEH